MLRRLFDWFRSSPVPREDSAEAEDAWYDEKSSYMESVLGTEYDKAMHSLVPYASGGGLDLYYYPHGIAGTGFATKELVDAHGHGPSNSVYDCYELLMFTRLPINLHDAQDSTTSFGSMHASMNAVMNVIARYSREATLNPYETCEFPAEMELVGGKCLVFDGYTSSRGPKGMGLLLIIEVHRSEMEYAMQHDGAGLITMLKQREHYPYSDLDRPPVV